ncbi:MAG: hypothetical protein QF486_05280 [Candidatus Woesearchaeota archaeon]|nr:hypothetical protein [Candidatus Woesearchaeota archaeon]MDP7199000.1 hypothetical protein [Candidatus Woesearchaeota archaeon]MDP7467746.1 hypothetical protein [Candidatus Woesearchaeota archaeon]MDP7646830.1 hypothetical protein [Candidatus Woesearchaeota archaeon]
MLQRVVDSIVGPIGGLAGGVANALPGLIAALIVLIVGYFVALLVRWIVRQVLSRVNLDGFTKRSGAGKVLGDLKVSFVLAELSRWYTFILFLPPAAEVISSRLSLLSELLYGIARWIPNFIAAVLILIAGLIAAEYSAGLIESTKAKHGKVVAGIAKFVVVLFTLLVALKQINIDVSIAETSFVIVLAGIMGAIAIGFGLGLKDHASSIIGDYKKRL